LHWRPRRRQDPQPTDGELVNETEQFLAGQYLEVAFAREGDLPTWVWLSTIAHGNEDQLSRAEDWLSEHEGLHPELRSWGRVLQHISRQMLDTAAFIGCSVSELQRNLLVPLELAVAITPVGPATLCRLVDTMLADAKSKIGSDRA
jgi:hypothetical protein